MTDKEITEWEHRENIIKVLTSYEMGAWLHRRDCRLLTEIRQEIEAYKHQPPQYDDMFEYKSGIDDALYIINKYIEPYMTD